MSFSRVASPLVALALAAAPLPLAAKDGAPRLTLTKRDAKVHLDAAMKAFDEGRYHDAIVSLDAAYAIEPAPQLLYARAQARRLAGECASALPLYEYFLSTSPPRDQARDAEVNIKRCRAAISVGDVPPDPAAEGPEPPPEPELPPPPPPRDAVGIALTGTGAALTATGLALVLVAATHDYTGLTETEFDAERARMRGLSIGGFVSLGAGLGLLAGGVARLALRARARRQAAAADG